MQRNGTASQRAKVVRALIGFLLLSLIISSVTAKVEAAALRTSLTLSSSPNPALVGQSITIAGMLTSSGRGVSAQTVQVQYSSNKAKWIKIVAAITGSDGSFSANWSPTSQGSRYVRAVFAGATGYAKSTSEVLTQQVNAAPAPPPQPPQTVQFHKGIVIEAAVILNGLPAPSLSQLKQANFTSVGTDVLSTFDSSQTATVTSWVGQAHSLGLTVFAMVHAEPTLAAQLVKRAVSIGFDTVVLDELAGTYNVTKAQLLSVIDAGLALNPNLIVVVTEFWAGDIKAAYSWTINYATVRVATDNYGDRSIIDLGIQQAQQYGKQPLVWLLSADYLHTDCYANLDAWIAYVKQRNLETLFYSIDPPGSWQVQWAKVQGF